MIVLNTQVDDRQCNSCRNEAQYEIQVGLWGQSASYIVLCKNCFEKLRKLMEEEDGET